MKRKLQTSNFRHHTAKKISDILEYFSFFSYPPTFEEIYTFFPEKLTRRRLTSILDEMEKKILIINWKVEGASTFNFLCSSVNIMRYTLPQYSKKTREYRLRLTNSFTKVRKILPYVQLLTFVSSIKLIGLSGSVSMFNAREEDDIDLFIITARNRLFTGRFIALLVAELFGLRRKSHYPDHIGVPHHDKETNKACLNLFFDERNLTVPNFKKTEYVAHEILQMKPLIDKDNTYLRFIQANKWVFKFFPNAKNQISNELLSFKIKNLDFIENFKFQIANSLEEILKKLQLYFIKKHQTTEIITDSQLWFHPDDFEKKLAKKE